MDVLRMWQTQPRFYVDQTIGAVFDLLTPPNPDEARITVVTELLEGVPGVLDAGRANLTGEAIAEFAQGAVDELDAVEEQVPAMADALAALPEAAPVADPLRAAGRTAGTALVEFRDWVTAGLPDFARASRSAVRCSNGSSPRSRSPRAPLGSLGGSARAGPGDHLGDAGAATGPGPLDTSRCPRWTRSARRRSPRNSPSDILRGERVLTQPDTLHHYHFRPLPDTSGRCDGSE